MSGPWTTFERQLRAERAGHALLRPKNICYEYGCERESHGVVDHWYTVWDCRGEEGMNVTIEEDEARYLAACHAMQSGVAAEQERGMEDASVKHLRVGINSAMIAGAALAQLLIDRGLFTLADYVKAQADEMEAEVARYEARLSAAMGADIHLR